ncbi:uncharacterized protein LOC126883134 [Diabrotica virgifera virgifera]|uniref:Uncharacterized protein LOC114341602 n=1 Tax=Diabrotica virgifera virgifera TaxID=50390 RepID=A0A6P7GSF0_DIAVI|nr:uncharacterized protein LOC126883134 [Diabrotica virgifera virgifera]
MATKISVILFLCLAIWKQNAVDGNKNLPGNLITYGNSQYFIADNVRQCWWEAWRYCKSLYMDLVSIESQEENNFLYEKLKERYGSGAEYSFWTAGAKKGRGWVWKTTRLPIYYFNWDPNVNAGNRIEVRYNGLTGLHWNVKRQHFRGIYAICEAAL